MQKPHLKLVGNEPVQVSVPKSAAVLKAQSRYGKPFLHERGSPLKWTSGPTVLEAWLDKRKQEKRK